MKILLVLACIIQIPFVVIVLFDVCSEVIHNLQRFHIGHWKNEQEWRHALLSCAQKWLFNPPIVRATEKNKYYLLRLIMGEERNTTIQCWQQAGLVLGLLSCDNEENRNILDKWEKKIVTTEWKFSNSPQKVDGAMLGYALLKQSMHPERLKPAADQIYKVIMDNYCDDGMISYSQGKNSVIRYVDTLGMVCPFLTLYGRLYNNPEIISLALKQIEMFHEDGLYLNTNLPCHAYEINNKMPLGVYGWGRGTAWYTIALVDTVLELPECPQKSIIKSWIKDAAEEYLSYQKDDGSFETILQGGGQYDSSSTAAMAYFYSVCGRLFNSEKYKNVAKECIKRLMVCTMRDGAIDQCQGDTHGIGIFSQEFDVMPFVQGLAIRAINQEYIDGKKN